MSTTPSIPPDQIQLVAYLTAKPGQEQALTDAITAIVPHVLSEPGCITYAAHISRDDPRTVVMYEVWANQTALDIHAKASAFTSLAARFDELLGAPLRLELLRRVA
ncbi:putative quinol monooxygenase [Nitrospirillum amazonense]|uniref:Quinol monooxygenase YgiN n=1 Tax=Nitrospirillum amazonense TaxID=28077 RepID=A0A560J3Z8_9PROT|nr:putative quinol monooxygenase [Nitrospirillum amazonense]MDG3439095.1 putative quinol monooxygenase [Nitrospirillum amazonense]TWB65968.1 quinol monooxygenase YgiN [Nitrospirillum amazonense]